MVVDKNTQNQVDRLRQRIAAGRSRADAMFTAFSESPARETPGSLLDNKEKLRTILASLNERKLDIPPVPAMEEAGMLTPSPGFAGQIRAKNPALS